MLDVIRDARRQQYDIDDKNNGRCYRFRFSPYKTLDNRIDGVVLSVVETDESAADGEKGAAVKKSSSSKSSGGKNKGRK